MPDVRPALQLIAQLQLAVRMLETPTAELGELIATVPGVVIGEPDGDDPLLEPLASGDDEDAEPWRFRDVPQGITADVWIDGDPPFARANRAALPPLRVAADGRDVQFMLRALRSRGSHVRAGRRRAGAAAAAHRDRADRRRGRAGSNRRARGRDRHARLDGRAGRMRLPDRNALHAGERGIGLAD